MSGLFRNGPRARGLPRARPAPEHNVIQRPELVRQLQRFLGLRQAHVAPALNDGVQPVIVVGDLGREAVLEQGGYASGEGTTSLGDGTLAGGALFHNPGDSGVKAQLVWFMMQGIGQSGTPVNVNVQFTHSVSTAFPFLLTPDNNGPVWLDGNAERMERVGGISDSTLPFGNQFYPRNQGQPKCALFVGKIPVSNPADDGAIFRISINDSITDGNRVQQFEPKGLCVYPNEQILWRMINNAGAAGTFELNLVWLESPAGRRGSV